MFPIILETEDEAGISTLPPMASIPPSSRNSKWPNNARAAIVLTLDNMGEAADLDRNLWPIDTPIGNHYSVMQVIPQLLAILARYDVSATYFIESWNLNVYSETVREVASRGHEVAWHAWRHEAWSKLKDETQERANFARSFGDESLKGFIEKTRAGETTKVEAYKGFRPPSGIIHGQRTLNMCREYGLKYISPAGHEAAVVPIEAGQDSIVVLPFRWQTVDAYYYMETFSKLRVLTGEPEGPQSARELERNLIAEIEAALARGGYLSVLFHPFLTNTPERLEAFEAVVSCLAMKRDEGTIWLARCEDVAAWSESHPGLLGSDPGLDETQWR